MKSKKILNTIKLILILLLCSAHTLPAQKAADSFCLRPIAEARKTSSPGGVADTPGTQKADAGSGPASLAEKLLGLKEKQGAVPADMLPSAFRVPAYYIDARAQEEQRLIELYGRPFEKDDTTIVEISQKDWRDINYILAFRALDRSAENRRCVLHSIDTKKPAVLGEDLFAFPLLEGNNRFMDSVPILSYVSNASGEPVTHVFITRRFYEDYIMMADIEDGGLQDPEKTAPAALRDLRALRLAELIYCQELRHFSGLAPVDRDINAAMHSRLFIPRGEQISSYDKWIIDKLVTSIEGRDCLQDYLKAASNVLARYHNYSAAPSSGVSRKERLYFNAFSTHAETALARYQASPAAQRQAHHLLRAYRQGDMSAFRNICREMGINGHEASFMSLNDKIEEVERRHVRELIAHFNPDVVITKNTMEMIVRKDSSGKAGIVEKIPKKDYVAFITNEVMRDSRGSACLANLIEAEKRGDPCDEEEADYLFSLYRSYRERVFNPLAEDYSQDYRIAIMRLAVSNYMNCFDTEQLDVAQKRTLEAYQQAERRLGGLITEFVIVDNRVYPEEVTPVMQYFQELADNQKLDFATKRRIGEGVLEKCLECLFEATSRGVVIKDFRIPNFGIRSSGEVVLLDLGRCTFLEREDMGDRDSARLFLEKLNDISEELRNLPLFREDETAPVPAVTIRTEADTLGRVLAGFWGELIIGKKGKALWEYWKEQGTGQDSEQLNRVGDPSERTEVLMMLSALLPRTQTEKESRYRKITFISTPKAAEEILQAITRHLEAAAKTSSSGQQMAESELAGNAIDKPALFGFLKVPSTRRHFSKPHKKVQDIIDWVLVEGDVRQEVVRWESINRILRIAGLPSYGPEIMCALHVVKGKGQFGNNLDELFGFPVNAKSNHLKDSVPVVSYVAPADNRLHMFVTEGFFRDYLQALHLQDAAELPSSELRQLQDKRLAEIIDHEMSEHGADPAVRQLSEEARHHEASKHARHFLHPYRHISRYHKWVIDALSITEEGRTYLMELLKEVRPAPEEQAQKDYEDHFQKYVQLRCNTKQQKFSSETRRLSHHVIDAFRFGNKTAFKELCREARIGAGTLEKQIARLQERQMREALSEFKPDIIIEETYETIVLIDTALGIVKKLPKRENVHFVTRTVLGKPGARKHLEDLEACFRQDRPFTPKAVEQLFMWWLIHNGIRRPSADFGAEEKNKTVHAIVSDYVNRFDMQEQTSQQERVRKSYIWAQQRLGGLISDFMIIDNEINQKKIVSVPDYLLDLAEGVGSCQDRADYTVERKEQLGADILQKALTCVVEAAKRGVIVTDLKIDQFGVTEEGEVVLFDLGPLTFSQLGEERDIDVEEWLKKIGGSAYKLLHLGGEGSFVETGTTRRAQDEQAITPLRMAWAREWVKLTSGRSTLSDRAIRWIEHEPDATRNFRTLSAIREGIEGDGMKILREIKAALPQTKTEARRRHRNIVYIPTAAAKEEILAHIMQRVHAASTRKPRAKRQELPVLVAQHAILSSA